MPSLTPGQAQQIHEYIHNQQLIYAIKLYRQATGVGLTEAKEAVEAMARGEAVRPPSDAMDYDNPVLEARIESLLSKRQKIEAVKIYREEYGVGLKEAKDAVDSIEVSMKQSGPSMSLPYESAISNDPFADDDASKRQKLTLLAVVIAVALCGAAAYFWLVNF
jgi:ribosomal protein L7/L12